VDKEYKKKLELEQQKIFNIAKWELILSDARGNKAKWEAEAKKNLAVRDNETPFSNMENDEDQNVDKYYIDNWLLKNGKWLKSLILGSELDVFLKSDIESNEDQKDIAEQELNFAIDRFRVLEDQEDVLENWYWTGLGVSSLEWDTLDKSKVWRTGKAKLRCVDPFSIYIDCDSRDKNYQDRKYVFEIMEGIRISELLLMFPEKEREIIADYGDEEISLYTKKVDLVVLQMKQEKIVEKFEVIDSETQETFLYRRDEIQEFLDNDELPENIIITNNKIKERENNWFNIIWIENTKLILQEAQYIGDKDCYQFMTGLKRTDEIYTYSLVSYLRDMQEISVILMTSLAYLTVKEGKNTPVIEEGALVNEEDYIKNHSQLNSIAVVDKIWRTQNPGTRAVSTIENRVDGRMAITLHQMIQEVQKNTSGSVDSARGEAQYSGQSGIQVARLQEASKVFTELDQIVYRSYLTNISYKMLDYLSIYRNYPHKIKGITPEGKEGFIDVGTTEKNKIISEDVLISITLEQDPELIKTIKKQLAIQLHSDGLITGLDLLKDLNYPDAETKHKNKVAENELLQLAEMLQQNPEMVEQLMQMSNRRKNES